MLLRGMMIVVAIALLTACAHQPASFRISPSLDPRDGEWPVWPKGGQQSPRFVYVGELTGEQNFGRDTGSQGRGFWAWVVGLGVAREEPLVLRRPQGIAESDGGRIWVTDVSLRAVFLFDTAAGELKVIDSLGGNRRLVAPIGVAPLPDGGVAVTDAELGVVALLDREGVTQRVVGGGVLVRPTGIAADPDGERLYVADTRANDVKVIDREGRLLATIGSGGSGDGQLNAPTYLALGHGRLYVTDTLNARIQVFDIDGDFLGTFGERGLYVGNLTRPKGIAVAPDDGLVYVIESYYDHLLVFDLDGRFLLPIGGTGSRPGEFYLPTATWAGEGGRVFVSDMFNGRVAVLQFLGGEP